MPAGVVNLVMGPGDTVGEELQTTRASTASCSPARTRSGSSCSSRSRRAGRDRASSRWAARTRRSCSRSADLEEAAEGIMRCAFGFGGQKCSANSRVYVEQPVHDELVRLLVEKTEKLTVGDPIAAEELARPDHRPEGGRPAPAGRRRGSARRQGVHRRRAPDRRRPGPRLLRRADGRRQPARVRTACSRTSCSRRSPRSRRSTRSTRRSASRTTRSTA